MPQLTTDHLPSPSPTAAAPQAYFPVGYLAVNPAYIGTQISKFCAAAPFTLDPTGRVATVTIGGGGPLQHHTDSVCDSYDEIKDRVRAACGSSAEFVLLSIDSPGGLLAGCFDTVTELRAIAAQANKRLVAYVDSQATSAAYALCLAADYITIPTTGLAGSIGVIEGIGDETVADRLQGRAYKFLASGQLKTAGNTHIPFADREPGIQAAAETVDGLAAEFFKLVATYRPRLTPDSVRAQQAGIYFGANAVSQGLADQVLTLDETVRMLASTGWPAAQTEPSPATEPSMTLRESLAKVAEATDSSPEDRERAKKMLAEYDQPAHKEPDGDEPKEEPKKDEAKKAEAEPAPKDEPKEEPKKDEAKALAATAEHAAKIALLATRPDFSAEQRKTLLASTLSLVTEAVTSWPKAMAISTDTPVGHVSAAIKAQATATSQPAPVTTSPQGLPQAEADALAVRMGLKAQSTGPQWDGEFYRMPVSNFQPNQKDSK